MKSMNLRQSILFFGIPGLWIYINYTLLLPRLLNSGFPMLYGALLLMAIPILGLIAFIAIDYLTSPMVLTDFLFIKKLSKKELIISLVLFFGVQLGELLLQSSRTFLTQIPGFSAPSYYPDIFLPNYEIKIPVQYFLDMKLEGNFMIILIWAVWLIINIGGEEILWRGYALKRMERHFGKWAWLVNGLLWNIAVHFFIRWSFIALLPVSLIVPYICQKTRSLWPGVIIHGLGNLLVYVIIIPGVLS